MKRIEKKIKFLRSKLKYWEYVYYVRNDSEISDERYDQYMEELRALEIQYPELISDNSPIDQVGGIVQDGFYPIRHVVPMLSLDNVFDKLSLLQFDNRIRTKLNYKDCENVLYCCELKIDGVAIDLVYIGGILTCASTRGNGVVGEDVTKNAQTISSIPKCLNKDEIFPEFLEIRGEVFMSNDCFKKLNQLFLHMGVKQFSNPRNAASGSLRQIDSSVTSERSLDFLCYNVAYYCFKNSGKRLSDSHWDRLQQCNVWGFPIVQDYTRMCLGISKVLDYFNEIQKIRSLLKFNIDGIVVKVNSNTLQKKLGMSSRAPRWAVSYKFPVKNFLSVIRDVHFKISRTGTLVPVASLEPVLISGVLIRSVNLHNINVIHRLGLMIGDSVCIKRAGDVIPHLVKVVLSARSYNKVYPIIYPDYCPVCKSVLQQVVLKKSVVLRCNAGWYCLGQRKGILKHFVSRKAMNIVGMGEKVIDRLVNMQLLCTPVDFFRLDVESFSCIEGVKEKLAYRLLDAITVSKQTTFSRFIYSLAIPNVGEVTAFVLAKTYGSIDNLIVADIKSLLSVKDIGVVVAHNIFNFFRNNYNLYVVNQLISPEIGIRW